MTRTISIYRTGRVVVRDGAREHGETSFDGVPIVIENPVGSVRRGVGPGGKPWSVQMTAIYGFVHGTQGADGDGVDVYLVEKPERGSFVYVFNQHRMDGVFDEHKCVLGAKSLAEAISVYDAHFADGSGPKRRRSAVMMTAAEFLDWARSRDISGPIGEDFDA